jgi:adenosylcobinamide-phosphate guanylyltransferase
VDALIICGGRGTRLDTDAEKPLYEIAGKPMVDRVLAALRGSDVDEIHAAPSPHTPDTRAHLRGGCHVVETPGDGYVADLDCALEAVSTPVLTVTADLPLLAPAVIDRVLAEAAPVDGTSPCGSLAVCVPATLKRRLGASVDTAMGGLAPSGCNVVAETGTERTYVSYDARLAVNVNRGSDADLAEALLVDTLSVETEARADGIAGETRTGGDSA